MVRPRAGRALDSGRLTARGGLGCGLLLAAAGPACAMLPGLAGVLLATTLIGIGTGPITPLGFAALASATPEERLGQSMGAAGLGRELGYAGGPLLVHPVAATVTYGFAALAMLLAAGPSVAPVAGSVRSRRS
ncbi:hypothetical protein [Streptomyces rhizosphaerihabitans]|uniref:hypothetical protein n=1 Tax=Streptomyces rhizosphaerihabitans TaxID=1266770 RepID=UPI0021BFA38B|nr:hypothetical protein [Streptomyces rhizosphaerihabitans]MCT9009193.1 hypothetical protein [Streptomyces rhizosphaerihabitans]